ncbi:MAG: TSUP family transporter [Pseudonocardiaceae bacterium]
MHLYLVVAGLVVGVLVGLTGMGGGALLTPLLVQVFRVAPLATISSDLLTSLVMKPVGAAVHLRRGSVNWPLVGWLTSGSVRSRRHTDRHDPPARAPGGGSGIALPVRGHPGANRVRDHRSRAPRRRTTTDNVMIIFAAWETPR